MGVSGQGFVKTASEGGDVLSGVGGENSSGKCWEIGRTTYGVFRGEIMGPKSSSNIGKEGKEKQREEEREKRRGSEEERQMCQKRTRRKRNPPKCIWYVRLGGLFLWSPGTGDF